MAIKDTLAIKIGDDNDNDVDSKAEIYSYLLDNVYNRYLKISGVQPFMRFQLLIALLIIGSKRSRLFLVAFHYLSQWQWTKATEPIINIIVQLLRHYLISVLEFNIEKHHNNLSVCKTSLNNVINRVLSKTMLTTFNDNIIIEEASSLKEQLIQVVSSKNPLLQIIQLKHEYDLDTFCEKFDRWARRIFNLVSTSNQFCYDYQKLNINIIEKPYSTESSKKRPRLVTTVNFVKATPQKGHLLEIIHEEENIEMDIEMEMNMDLEIESTNRYTNSGTDQDNIKDCNSESPVFDPLFDEEAWLVDKEETKHDDELDNDEPIPLVDKDETKHDDDLDNDEQMPLKQQSFCSFGDRMTAFFSNIASIMDEDDDSSFSSDI